MKAKTIIMSALIAIGCTTASDTYAWDLGRSIGDAANRIVKSARVEGGRAADSVKRANPIQPFTIFIRYTGAKDSGQTSNHVFYSVENRSNYAHFRGNTTRFQGQALNGRPSISFKQPSGFTSKYTLISGKTYEFRWAGKTLVLERLN